MVTEGAKLWEPRPEFANASNVHKFLNWLRENKQLDLADYDALYDWSIFQPEAFWASLWDYFDIQTSSPYAFVVDDIYKMPGAKWFDGAKLNYAEHLLRAEAQQPDKTVFHHLTEIRPLAQMSWGELGNQVRKLATRMRDMGIEPGDRIVSYMPNTPETAIAMMASVAVGAVWSSAAPEFGVNTVIDRFTQIQPKWLFAADGYRFAGKDFSRVAETEQIAAALPSLEQVIWLETLPDSPGRPTIKNLVDWADLFTGRDIPREEFQYTRVEADHPLWVLFSSGTTGVPKAIVHGHAGVLIEHLKLIHFHINGTPDSVMFFYSTTGWVMWNILLSMLSCGGAAVLYDGNPAYPGPDLLWKLAADTGSTVFGASPMYVQLMEKAGIKPGENFDLSALSTVVVSGAPSTPETFAWFYRDVKEDLWLTSQSGGTEIASGFVGAVPTLPVYAGEIQARMLGMAVEARNDANQPVVNEVGELVVTHAFPSMPIYFWGDTDNKRYNESYFDATPGIWTHGDFIKINHRGGCYIYGRSDSTLNRHGVRIGTAEIYRCLEPMPEIADSMVVCCDFPGGKQVMPLFLKLAEGQELTDELKSAIATKLRKERSPRHVPDEIFAMDAIPYTLTGKKMEIPIRKLLTGVPLEKAASRDAMMNPAAIDEYLALANSEQLKSWAN